MQTQSPDAVTMISWPTQRVRRDWCHENRLPRILVIEPGQQPPVVTDIFEDWVRAPLAKSDLDVRIDSLAVRYRRDNRPYLDSDDNLVFRGRRAVPSPSQVALLRLLVNSFGEEVERRRLLESLDHRPDDRSDRRNQLDLHIGRLRRKIKALGLSIRTEWGSGYALEPHPHAVSRGQAG